VLAAVKTGAQTIVTFNLKDFKKESLRPWDVQAQSPDAFLVDQYYLDPSLVLTKLQEQSQLHSGAIDRLLTIHERSVPKFVEFVRSHLAGDGGKHDRTD
jgi:hypothetical protein